MDNSGAEVTRIRRDLVEMLFVEGNHYCMFCERSGHCELQAQAYRLGIPAPKYPYLFPDRSLDASHPDILIDRNRCIQCGRCVAASKDVDGKNVFQFVGRGPHKRIAVNAEADLKDTAAAVTDKALDACPVGALLKKRTAYAVPVGRRPYDHQPIGSNGQKN
ncbi:MAG: NAD-reducing hydrogenase HoxS subunit gamma [Lentisphaerae bacterium ADurb.BinA184]|nr:MAG: NAD-reducing hydrogenase HoxS subunit gamma [Lentisphaerae bacterium ADurb.BinA184]